jgi:hypothetical protein
MRDRRTWLVLILAAIGIGGTRPAAAPPVADRVIVVTVDGVRWQEVFGGASAELVEGKDGGAPDAKALAARFLRPTAAAARQALMPFFWQTVATAGQVFGDPSAGATARVANGLWFSYPGYSEMLTGVVDPRIDSNGRIPNPNVSVLEFLAGRPAFKGAVDVVGSWDLMPFIFNTARSGLPTNWAVVPFDPPRTDRERALNDLAADMPAYWDGERFDAVTMQVALEHLRTKQPRVLYVLLGDTDEWAHERRYDLYLDLIYKSDRFIRALWDQAQSMPAYKGRTALVIATDHGRGAATADWVDHGRKVPAAERVWMAVLGPDTPPLGIRKNVTVTLGQVAATVAALLGERFDAGVPSSAPPLPDVVRR